MKIHVRLFAAARQLAHRDELEIECNEGATVADVRHAIAVACPALAPLLPHVRVAVNTEYADEQQVVGPDDQIACIPPVSGG
jgi:molybdopterin converting factor subunit 1